MLTSPSSLLFRALSLFVPVSRCSSADHFTMVLSVMHGTWIAMPVTFEVVLLLIDFTRRCVAGYSTRLVAVVDGRRRRFRSVRRRAERRVLGVVPVV